MSKKTTETKPSVIKRLVTIENLTAKDYQEFLTELQDKFPKPVGGQITVSALGLPGETGEVCEILKRYFREGVKPDKNELAKELGDVIGYVTLIANHFQIDLDDILRLNLGKINTRIEEGKCHGKGSDR